MKFWNKFLQNREEKPEAQQEDELEEIIQEAQDYEPGDDADMVIPESGEDQEYQDLSDGDLYDDLFGGEESEEGENTSAPTPRKRRRKRPHRKAIKAKGSGLLGIPHFVTSLVLIALIVAIGVTGARIMWLWADDVLALTKQEKIVSVSVEDTDTMNDIIDKLHDAGLVTYPKVFGFYCDFTGAREKISAGTFNLNAIYDYHALINAMSGYSAERQEVDVMIPEGYTCRQIFALLERNEVCTVAELEKAAMEGDMGDRWFLEGVSREDPYCLEGFLFPDTYKFYTHDDPERVLRKLIRNFDNKFDDEMIAQLGDLNNWIFDVLSSQGYGEEFIKDAQLDIRELVTVASMVERETSGTGESATIASVIYNRLNHPAVYPYLNIDATIVYALGDHEGALTYDDLEIDSPYNTYRNPGLPAGPISNPGLSSLKAALKPRDTDYYFYALDSDGTHYFTKTAEEHQAFLNSQRQEENDG